MALRVLLADESATIKKVIQLALQDFEVEVKAVPVGLDVLPVFESFQPDIVFVDILLAKKNGYETCFDLKNNPKTSKTPVILMWSGFMEIDEAKAQSSKADARLEKPFDADQLRTLVKNLVPKLNEDKKKEEFPEFVDDFMLENTDPGIIPEPVVQLENANIQHSDSFMSEDMDSNEEKEDFVQAPLSSPAWPNRNIQSVQGEDSEDWAQQDLSKFKLDIPIEDEIDLASKYSIPIENLSDSQILNSAQFEELTSNQLQSDQKEGSRRRMDDGPNTPSFKRSSVEDIKLQVQLSQDDIEKIVREEIKAVIESIVWKIAPDISERIIREEIAKLLRDAESSI